MKKIIKNNTKIKKDKLIEKLIFATNKKHPTDMDKECIPLCNILNSLPGINTLSSCQGHGTYHFNIIFQVKDTIRGLYFLLRSVNRNYWEYGYLWNIEVFSGDGSVNKQLPVYFSLNSGPIAGQHAILQAQSLKNNLEYHLNHYNFIKYHIKTLDGFDIKTLKLTQKELESDKYKHLMVDL